MTLMHAEFISEFKMWAAKYRTLSRQLNKIAQSNFHTLHLETFLNQVKDTLKPPVANKIMFNGSQLQIMIVAGPNNRDDFHQQPGPELFVQLQGHMELHVHQKSSSTTFSPREKVTIQSNQFFELPSKILHSPQRFSHTFGLVFETNRRKHYLKTSAVTTNSSSGETENLDPDCLDSLQWFDPISGKLLYKELFFCTDLGTQLKPVIERFLSTDIYKQHFINCKIPRPEVLEVNYAEKHNGNENNFSIKLLKEPSNLNQHVYMQAMCNNIHSSTAVTSTSIIHKNEYTIELYVGPGAQYLPRQARGDVFIWQLRGSSKLTSIIPETSQTSAKQNIQHSQRGYNTLDSPSSFLASVNSPVSSFSSTPCSAGNDQGNSANRGTYFSQQFTINTIVNNSIENNNATSLGATRKEIVLVQGDVCLLPESSDECSTTAALTPDSALIAVYLTNPLS